MITIGSTVGNYEVIAKIGSGAMGVVFLAEHPSIGKRVALKVIHTDLAENAEMVSRFFTEARAITQIQNQHVVDVQNFGQTPDGDNFIVMEYLEGRGLGAILKERKTLPLDVAIHIARQIADGLAASHARGIIHRDLKPDNVFVVPKPDDEWFIKILDFGLAKLTQGGGALSHKTATGSVLGTPHYMAPEQCEGRADIDHRVDIYALGCILYELVCGQVPFPGEGFGEVLVKHLREPPMMPTRLNPSLPPSVENIILHALAKKREYRFQSMTELRAALTDPERYTSALTGDHPMGKGTMELLAQSSAVSPRAPALAEQATRMLEAPQIKIAPAPAPAEEQHDTMLSMEAPVMPEGQPTAILEAPTDLPHRYTPVPEVTRRGINAPPGTDLDDDEVPARRSRSTTIIVAIAAVVVFGCAGLAAILLGGGPRAPELTQVIVSSEPVGAEVRRDGKSLGKTPYMLKLAASERALLAFSREGYLDAQQTVSAGAPEITVTLKPLPPKPPVEAPPPVESPPARPPAARHPEPPAARPPAARPPAAKPPAAKPPAAKPHPPGPSHPQPARLAPHAAPHAPSKTHKKVNPAHYDDVMVPRF